MQKEKGFIVSLLQNCFFAASLFAAQNKLEQIEAAQPLFASVALLVAADKPMVMYWRIDETSL